jgi:hypothetical protein
MIDFLFPVFPPPSFSLILRTVVSDMLIFVTCKPALGHGLLFSDTRRGLPLFFRRLTGSLLQCFLKFTFSARYVNHLQFESIRIYSAEIVF